MKPDPLTAQTIQVIRHTPENFAGFHTCLDSVARERVFLEMIEAPAYQSVADRQKTLLESGGPLPTLSTKVGW